MLRCAVLLCWPALLPALLFHPDWTASHAPPVSSWFFLEKPDSVTAGVNGTSHVCLAQISISWVLNWTQPNKAPLRQARMQHRL